MKGLKKAEYLFQDFQDLGIIERMCWTEDRIKMLLLSQFNVQTPLNKNSIQSPN